MNGMEAEWSMSGVTVGCFKEADQIEETKDERELKQTR